MLLGCSFSADLPSICFHPSSAVSLGPDLPPTSSVSSTETLFWHPTQMLDPPQLSHLLSETIPPPPPLPWWGSSKTNWSWVRGRTKRDAGNPEAWRPCLPQSYRLNKKLINMHRSRFSHISRCRQHWKNRLFT